VSQAPTRWGCISQQFPAGWFRFGWHWFDLVGFGRTDSDWVCFGFVLKWGDRNDFVKAVTGGGPGGDKQSEGTKTPEIGAYPALALCRTCEI
jgi:hypothetical protein